MNIDASPSVCVAAAPTIIFPQGVICILLHGAFTRVSSDDIFSCTFKSIFDTEDSVETIALENLLSMTPQV